MRSKTSVSDLFYAGNHRAVIERTLDHPEGDYLPSDFPFLVGALIHLGRLDEAERLYKLKKQLLEVQDLITCRYFLGIGFCRHSFYSKARRYFYENFTERRLVTDGRSQFFIFQGLGFYHYFAGRMGKALRNAEKALTAALSAKYLYGRALSMDLKGHALIQTGSVGPGLETLHLAEALAKQLGAHWLSDAIQVSLVSYRAKFGIDAQSTLEAIKSKLASLSKQDTYSQSTLLLDLAQEHIRRGNLPEAKNALNDCCRIVYALNNRRHAALLNLRYAYLHLLEGDPHLSLNLIRNALTQIEPKVDIALELRLRGLEERLVAGMKLEKCTMAQLTLIEHLTKRVRETTGERIVKRKQNASLSTNHLGEDPFGDLMDLVFREPELAIEPVIENEYYGLLSDILPQTRGKRVLYLDLEPGSLTIFDKGTVVHLSGCLSRSVRSLLLELNGGLRSKEALIRKIWGYEYHPLRHDPLIYSAIAKIRKLLDIRSHWLEVTESGYSLRSGVEVCAYAERVMSAPPIQTTSPSLPSLNHRQQKILRFLDENEFIDSMTCKSLFETSEITASRDLSQLLALQLVARMGKGRATKYTRRET